MKITTLLLWIAAAVIVPACLFQAPQGPVKQAQSDDPEYPSDDPVDYDPGPTSTWGQTALQMKASAEYRYQCLPYGYDPLADLFFMDAGIEIAIGNGYYDALIVAEGLSDPVGISANGIAAVTCYNAALGYMDDGEAIIYGP